MKPRYCQYCGQPLEDRCGCEREVAEAEEQACQDYYDDPEVQMGWRNEDAITFGHCRQM